MVYQLGIPTVTVLRISETIKWQTRRINILYTYIFEKKKLFLNGLTCRIVSR